MYFPQHHGCNGRLCCTAASDQEPTLWSALRPKCCRSRNVRVGGHKRTCTRSKACPLKSRHISSRCRDRTSVVSRKIKAPRYRAVRFLPSVPPSGGPKGAVAELSAGIQPPPLSLGPASYPAAVGCAAPLSSRAVLFLPPRHHRSSRAVLAAASANIAFNCDLVSSLGCLITGLRVDTTL